MKDEVRYAVGLDATVDRLIEAGREQGRAEERQRMIDDDVASNDKPEIIPPAPPSGDGVITINGDALARIILSECHTTVARATKAANRIIDYLNAQWDKASA